MIKHGDFTELAKQYINRPAYSTTIIKAILNYMETYKKEQIKIADIGAGTGKLTKVLLQMGLDVTAVEPNDKMRGEGIEYTKGYNVKWYKGSGEFTGLQDNSYNWVVMASSFHWTDPQKSLPEFSRILKNGGYFTAIWNPRNIEVSELHTKIENIIYSNVPNIKRVSSGAKNNTNKWEEILISTGHFDDVIFMETDYLENMTQERYMGAWKSVNDIRFQAGEEKFKVILDLIEKEIQDLDVIPVPYKMRAWTAKKIK